MLFRHHRKHRHCIPRRIYRVVNSSPYEEGLRQRGSITIWLDPSVRENWPPVRRLSRGHPFRYSDEVIEAVRRLRLLLCTPLGIRRAS
ncbi:transposase [Asaia sp. As-1742]|uniref:transposase n=1 Tax=Asaia sp. As-1742 TaxID=2608325 RepID=UPI0014224185|nr:hypothetical protein [Asaia sp. As-1742]